MFVSVAAGLKERMGNGHVDTTRGGLELSSAVQRHAGSAERLAEGRLQPQQLESRWAQATDGALEKQPVQAPAESKSVSPVQRDSAAAPPLLPPPDAVAQVRTDALRLLPLAHVKNDSIHHMSLAKYPASNTFFDSRPAGVLSGEAECRSRAAF